MLEEYEKIQRPVSPETLGIVGAPSAGLYKRDRKKQKDTCNMLTFQINLAEVPCRSREKRPKRSQ
ncbi:hypothetical protein Sjap_010354 [Stephania japonica]|uniref:Uncharacterized protein n=1 Tax=Stephania japonica TaxID=461633 RepID=A0AAP0J8Y3_9MAGN